MSSPGPPGPWGPPPPGYGSPGTSVPPSYGASGPASYPGQQAAFAPPGAFPAQQQQPGAQQPGMPHVSSFPGQMQHAAYAPAPFVQQQPAPQQFVPPPQQYGAPYQAAPPQPADALGGMAQMGIPGLGGSSSGGFMSGLSPINLMTGGLFAAPQQYVQQRVSWFKTNMTGGTMSSLFNISNSYAANKLLMLLLPFLGRWNFARLHEQIAGGQRYRPPSVDVNAPDLFIPLMAVWSYALLSCVVLALKGAFKPELMSSTLYSACAAWAVHWVIARVLLRALNVPGVAWSELLAYTGYAYVGVCLTMLGGFLGGKYGYYAVGAYCAAAMAVFMVRTMKRVIFQETRAYGTDMRAANYWLLALAALQFPFIFVLAYRPV